MVTQMQHVLRIW